MRHLRRFSFESRNTEAHLEKKPHVFVLPLRLYFPHTFDGRPKGQTAEVNDKFFISLASRTTNQNVGHVERIWRMHV